MVLLQMGHIHVGACSCNCRKDLASKHWLCEQIVERMGIDILTVETGSFKDMTLEPTTISGSLAFLCTELRSHLMFLGRSDLLLTLVHHSLLRDDIFATDLPCKVLNGILFHHAHLKIEFLRHVSARLLGRRAT